MSAPAITPRPAILATAPSGAAPGGEPQSPAADHRYPDALTCSVGGRPSSPAPANVLNVPPGRGPILYDPSLYLLASQLDNVEALRIAVENRHRQATRSVADSDGHLRGLGLPDGDPAVAASALLLESLAGAERKATLALQRALRLHPLATWQKCTVGVGEKQLARLLAVIGDPYWNTLHDRPRTVSELWAYCGLHVVGHPRHTGPDSQRTSAGVAARRQRGQRANWSTDAKTRAYLIAASCIKQSVSPYRAVYEQAREHEEMAVHATACAPCSAVEGTPLRAGHQHARAMRKVSKAILRDLWAEAKILHEP